MALGRMPNSFSCSTPVPSVTSTASSRAVRRARQRPHHDHRRRRGRADGDPDRPLVGVASVALCLHRCSAGHQRDGRADGRAASSTPMPAGATRAFRVSRACAAGSRSSTSAPQLGIRAHLRGPRHPQRAHAGLPRHRDLRRRRQQQGDDDLHRQCAESGHESLVGRFDHRTAAGAGRCRCSTRRAAMASARFSRTPVSRLVSRRSGRQQLRLHRLLHARFGVITWVVQDATGQQASATQSLPVQHSGPRGLE